MDASMGDGGKKTQDAGLKARRNCEEESQDGGGPFEAQGKEPALQVRVRLRRSGICAWG